MEVAAGRCGGGEAGWAPCCVSCGSGGGRWKGGIMRNGRCG